MIKIIHAQNLRNLAPIQHGFFARTGGVSSGCYASLNCGLGPRNQDDPQKVKKNLELAAQQFALPASALVTLQQVSGNEVVEIKANWRDLLPITADAMVTNLPGILLGATSADCAIVLLADPSAKVVACAHAGWRGAKANILAKTVHKMLELGAQAANITAAIGPCIAQKSYEVQNDFYQNFLAEGKENQKYFAALTATSFLFNLPAYVQDKLTALKIKSIEDVNIDTYTTSDFFSCRRALHQQENNFGVHLACIGLQ